MRFHKGFRDVRAWCETCGTSWSEKNAQGVAARHTDSTGHTTNVEIEQHVTYYYQGKKK